MIRCRKNKCMVYSKSGKKLRKKPTTKKKALAQLRAIEISKHHR